MNVEVVRGSSEGWRVRTPADAQGGTIVVQATTTMSAADRDRSLLYQVDSDAEFLWELGDDGAVESTVLFSTAPASNEVLALVDPPDVVAKRFWTRRDEWMEEVAFLSSTNAIAMHPAYQAIIAMGESVLPLILEDLGETGSQWFWALKAIAGEDPVAPEDRGDIAAMVATWMAWGSACGHV